MDKWKNCIYVNVNTAYNLDIIDSSPPSYEYIVKIGSSKCLPARYHSYKTYSPIKTEILRYYYLHDYDCYKLDADLKAHQDNHRIHSSGGIEFYYSSILDILEKYMLDRGIHFARYDTIDDFPVFHPSMLKELYEDESNRYQLLETYLATPLDLPTAELEPEPEREPELIKSVKIELSEHQLGILHQTLEYFKTHNKGILNLFCRYGKTRMSAAFTQAAVYAKVLILVPSLYLIEQTRKTWQTAFPSKIITISSDASDLSPADKTLIRRKLEAMKQVIVICTYHSSSKLAEMEFDLCIYDEAHRTTGDKSTFNLMVSNDKIRKKLFLTATMKYYDYLDNESDSLVINSMDNPAIYGDVIATVSAKRAKEQGRICPYSVMTMKLQEINPDDPEIQLIEANIIKFLSSISGFGSSISRKKQNKDSKDSSSVDDFISRNTRRYIRIALGLIKVIRERKMRHIITFHRYKKCARLFQFILAYIVKYNINVVAKDVVAKDDVEKNKITKITKKTKLPLNLDVNYLSGEDTKSARDEIIEEFNKVITLDNHHKVLCNAKVLQEGVDIPRCDTVCFVDLKTSAVDTIQSLARCMTWMPDKHAHIIIPFDEMDFKIDSPKHPDMLDMLDIKYSDYAMQLRLLLRNLVEIDDNIKEYFRQFSTRDSINGGGAASLSSASYDLENINLHCLIDATIIGKMCEIAFEVFTVAKEKIKGRYMTPEEYKGKVLADWNGDLPLEPETVYRGWGWHGWNDYLGIDPYMRPNAVRKLMHAVNTERLKTGLPMIETRIEYREYAKANNLMVELRPPHNNWCWLLLPEYDSLAARYYKTKEEIQAAIQKLGIKSITEYEDKQGRGLDARLAPYKMLAAGFYNENIPSIGQHVSNFITSLYENDDCFF